MLGTVGKLLHFLIQRIHDFAGRNSAQMLHNADEPVLAKMVSLPVFGLGETVGINQQFGSHVKIHAVALEVESLHDAQRDVVFGL